jgi:hypothetical protein
VGRWEPTEGDVGWRRGEDRGRRERGVDLERQCSLVGFGRNFLLGSFSREKERRRERVREGERYATLIAAESKSDRIG